jgi:hypothetical protein
MATSNPWEHCGGIDCRFLRGISQICQCCCVDCCCADGDEGGDLVCEAQAWDEGREAGRAEAVATATKGNPLESRGAAKDVWGTPEAKEYVDSLRGTKGGESTK